MRPRRGPTLGEVAVSAGVSLATASKVLNGRDDVAAGTRVRVQRLLDEQGYVPAAGRRPTGRRRDPRRRTIGLVFDDFMSPYATELIRGVTDAGTDLGADVVVGRFSDGSAGDSGGTSWARRLVEAGRDGVLVVTSDLTPRQFAGFGAAGLPLVIVDPVQAPRADVPSIGATNWTGALAATQHLIALGHRRIAYAGGPAGAAVNQARLHGYRAAMDNAGLPVDPAHVVDGDFGFETGLVLAARLLSATDRPTAVFAVTDVTAFGVIQAAHRSGLRVPEDLSVVGFDDTYMAAWSTPALTTVHTPLQEIGRVALRSLLRLVDGATLDSHHVELATSLVLRDSTAPPGGVRSSRGSGRSAAGRAPTP